MINTPKWTNPLTGETRVPAKPGEVLTAAVAYWQDQLDKLRAARPRKPVERAEKVRNLAHAVTRITRYRREITRMTHGMKSNKLTIQLATDDLSAVMLARPEKAAA